MKNMSVGENLNEGGGGGNSPATDSFESSPSGSLSGSINGNLNGNTNGNTNNLNKVLAERIDTSDVKTEFRTGSPTSSEAEFMSFERISESADYLMNRTKFRPEIAIICGSGLAGLADLLEDPDVFDYADIPNFVQSTVPGHKSRMIFGQLEGVQVMLMQGRFHAYEGYPLQLCGMPVRVMKLCGIKNLIVTNAAGGLNSNFRIGDIMIIKDHINLPGLSGMHPLKGPNDHRFGGRFFALNNCYDKEFRKIASSIASEMDSNITFHEGVYAMLGGPNFETVAELRMLKTCGVDACGMSTIPEVLVASHCGLRTFSFSLITNECVTEGENAPEHDEVIAAANQRQNDLRTFVSRMVIKMGGAQNKEK